MAKKRDEIYNFIINYMVENIIPPTVREIREGVELKSTSSVYTHLRNLEQMGKITMRSSEPRTIRPTGYKLIRILDEEVNNCDENNK